MAKFYELTTAFVIPVRRFIVADTVDEAYDKWYAEGVNTPVERIEEGYWKVLEVVGPFDDEPQEEEEEDG